MNAEIAKGVAANVSGITAAGLGGVVGGTTGAGAGLSVDANNRQLHPTEVQWIQQNAKRFAQQQKVSEQEAEKRLAQQAFRQVQFGLQGADDSQARTFLSQAKGMLEADPGCPSCGPGYMFFATPEQKLHTDMYATQVISDLKLLEFYGKNGISQPTSEQIRASANKDASSRSKIAGATLGAAAAATSLTVPPALSWCLTNPVACNRIVIAGGEIAAGDALGPAGLGVLGTASGVKAVRSAEEVNAAMKARGWEPAWSPGTPVIEAILQPGTKVNMIIDAKTAGAIQRGHIEDVAPGGWATFDPVKSVAEDMRQRAAITRAFKPSSQGPFFVVEMEIIQPIKSNIGFVGKQESGVEGLMRGGGSQIQFDESISGKGRLKFVKPSSLPVPLN
jgi:filamentous hemagglutinin